jgi:hypothetical protein
VNKIGCVILQVTLQDNFLEIMNGFDQSRYSELATCSVASFKKWHHDIDMHFINDSNFYEYFDKYYDKDYYVNHIGIVKFFFAYFLMKKENYDKIIILGCDTITCARLDEFIDDWSFDILASLNYPSVEETEYWKTPVMSFRDDSGNNFQDVYNLNADVVCFNSINALKKVLDLSLDNFTHYGEQGGLNELAIVDKSFSVNVVDFPYYTSKVSYNCRAKGVYGTSMIVKGKLAKHGPRDGEEAPTRKFYVKDDKLFTQDNKQIKIWHYVEGLGGRPDSEFNEIIADFKENWFNEETKKFFIDRCDCSSFFAYN